MEKVVGNCGKHPGQNMVNCPLCEIERHHQPASPELTEPSRQAGAYIVIAFRYGHRDGHSYLVDICGGFDTAKEVAEKEANERGGKYSCIVFAKHIPRNEIDEVYEAKCPEHYTQGTTTATELLRKYELQPHPPVSGWVSIHDKTRRMPAETDLLIMFDTGEVRRFMEEDLPAEIMTHWMPFPDLEISEEQPKENDPELIRLREENFLLKNELETLKHPL